MLLNHQQFVQKLGRSVIELCHDQIHRNMNCTASLTIRNISVNHTSSMTIHRIYIVGNDIAVFPCCMLETTFFSML